MLQQDYLMRMFTALAIAMREGGDILALGDNIAAEMASIVSDLPIGINAELVADQASTVDLADCLRIVRGHWCEIAACVLGAILIAGL